MPLPEFMSTMYQRYQESPHKIKYDLTALMVGTFVIAPAGLMGLRGIERVVNPAEPIDIEDNLPMLPSKKVSNYQLPDSVNIDVPSCFDL